ncbi:MAG: hypothetical protein RL205_977 [Actinomycetota bacterium]|jgi:diketogulonate reductase-like aldo/keto reductase
MYAYTLNNGVEIPALGFGVFQTAPEATSDAVAEALAVGYRLIDTAGSYLNERAVGDGLRRSGVDRSDVFIETKVWISDYGYEETLHSWEKASRKLGVEQIDLMLLHQPMPSDFRRTAEAYRALETLLSDGRVRSIGVSNFMVAHLDRLSATATTVPSLNQIECHPYFRQSTVIEKNAELGILTQAWSPMGGITHYFPGGPNVLEDPNIAQIAESHRRTSAQVMLRWHLQQGRCAVPKSVRPERIRENFDVFGFTLSESDLTTIDSLSTDLRRGPDPEIVTIEKFGREIPED